MAHPAFAPPPTQPALPWLQHSLVVASEPLVISPIQFQELVQQHVAQAEAERKRREEMSKPMSVSEIAYKYNVAQQTVRDAIKRAGLKGHPKPGFKRLHYLTGDIEALVAKLTRSDGGWKGTRRTAAIKPKTGGN